MHCLKCLVEYYLCLILEGDRKSYYALKYGITIKAMSFGCLVTVNVMKLFHMVPWVGLQFVIVVFPDYTHFLSRGQKSLLKGIA